MQNSSDAALESIATQPRKKRIRWWLIFLIFAVPATLICFTVSLVRIGYTVRERRGQQEMLIEINKLEQEGFPVDDESLAAVYANRTSPDRLEAWLALIEVFKTPEFKARGVGVPEFDPQIDEPFPYRSVESNEWPYAAASIKLVEDSTAMIEEIRRLAKDPVPVQFPIRFQSVSTLLPEVQYTREFARLMAVDAKVAINHRDSARALDDLFTVYQLGDHAAAVPFTVAKLAGAGCRNMALQILQACIQADLFDDEQLRQIDTLLAPRCEIGDQYREIMSEELGSVLPVFMDPTLAMKSKKPLPPRGHDALHYIGMFRRAINVETENWESFHESATQIEDDFYGHGKGLSIAKMDRILSGLFAPLFQLIADVLINHAQLHRQARIAIAIRLYEHEHGTLPANLAELPINLNELQPFGATPFGYQRNDAKAVLWGFHLSDRVKQVPLEVPSCDLGVPFAKENIPFVWEMNPKP